MKKAIIMSVLFFIGIPILFAHPGRLDRNGGHNGPDGYHYHNAPAPSVPKQSTPAPTPSSGVSHSFQDFLDYYLKERINDPFKEANDTKYNLAAYGIEDDVFRINMYIDFSSEDTADNNGESAARNCVEIMQKWSDILEIRGLDFNAVNFACIVRTTQKQYWRSYVQGGRVVTEKR